MSPIQLEANEDNSNFAQLMIYVTNMVENIVGKGENGDYPHFFLSRCCPL